MAKALVEDGIVGVIATDATLDTLRPALPASDRLELVPARLVKGLARRWVR